MKDIVAAAEQKLRAREKPRNPAHEHPLHLPRVGVEEDPRKKSNDLAMRTIHNLCAHAGGETDVHGITLTASRKGVDASRIAACVLVSSFAHVTQLENELASKQSRTKGNGMEQEFLL